ncbi:MAG: DUF59 domain-containing protein [Chloroflexi bacterium]|nr:DUF59 domain-containing protein [Chloroflexota bacterium]
MITKEAVIEALRDVYDPEIPVNVVDLGLIYAVDVEGDKVSVQMTLTAPGCPMHSFITADARKHVAQIQGVKDVTVDMVWDPPWTPERMSDEAKALLGWK